MLFVFLFYKDTALTDLFLDGQGTRYGEMGFANIAATVDNTGIINNPGSLFVHDNGNIWMLGLL
jgi:hypothetical protein